MHKSFSLSPALFSAEQQVHWPFITSAFSKGFISYLHCQTWIPEPTSTSGEHCTFFPFIIIFSPNFGIKTSPSPCGRPHLPGQGVKSELARRCSPFSRLLCIASAWFPSSSCWLCRQRSVPTGTGKTPALLGYFFISTKNRSALLIGSVGFMINAPGAALQLI